jgi:hypothetical protein
VQFQNHKLGKNTDFLCLTMEFNFIFVAVDLIPNDILMTNTIFIFVLVSE